MFTHYVLDVVGTTRGIALFYPFPREYALPIGVRTSSRLAPAVTLSITVVEIVLIGSAVMLAASIDVPAPSLSF